MSSAPQFLLLSLVSASAALAQPSTTPPLCAALAGARDGDANTFERFEGVLPPILGGALFEVKTAFDLGALLAADGLEDVLVVQCAGGVLALWVPMLSQPDRARASFGVRAKAAGKPLETLKLVVFDPSSSMKRLRDRCGGPEKCAVLARGLSLNQRCRMIEQWGDSSVGASCRARPAALSECALWAWVSEDAVAGKQCVQRLTAP
jgi:hypothetical protein